MMAERYYVGDGTLHWRYRTDCLTDALRFASALVEVEGAALLTEKRADGTYAILAIETPEVA